MYANTCGCMYAETLGCMYADFGCTSIKRLGAKYAVVGCIYMETFGRMYADFGCKVYGDVWVHVCTFWVHVCGNGWVQSMRLLGAKYADVGCMYAETLGCMYAVVGCKSDSG